MLRSWGHDPASAPAAVFGTPMNNLRISTKLAVAFAAMILVSTASSAVLFFSLQRIDEAADASKRSLSLMTVIEKVMGDMTDSQNSMRAFVANPAHVSQLDDYAETMAAVAKGLDEFEATTQLPAQKARVREMRAAVAAWRRDVGDPIIALAKDPATLEQARDLAGRRSSPSATPRSPSPRPRPSTPRRTASPGTAPRRRRWRRCWSEGSRPSASPWPWACCSAAPSPRRSTP